MSRVLRAAPVMLNEQSNILTSTEKPTTSKADPQTEAPIGPRQGDPVSRVTFACNMESSPRGFPVAQPRNVDAVAPEFPLDLHAQVQSTFSTRYLVHSEVFFSLHSHQV